MIYPLPQYFGPFLVIPMDASLLQAMSIFCLLQQANWSPCPNSPFPHPMTHIANEVIKTFPNTILLTKERSYSKPVLEAQALISLLLSKPIFFCPPARPFLHSFHSLQWLDLHSCSSLYSRYLSFWSLSIFSLLPESVKIKSWKFVAFE